MQSNMTASSTTAFSSPLNFNGNPNVNFLQQQQQQIQQNILQFNTLQQQQQQQVSQQQPTSQQQPNKDTTFTKIFVGGLPYHTTDESLSQFFQKFGNIEEAVVINDRQTGKSRGYGFVTMETKEAAEAAVLDPNPVIDGRKANVNLAYLGVKSRLMPPAGIIPLGLRYQQLPSQSPSYGFHPFYYHPAQNPTVHTPHAQYLSPNLLIPAQQNTNIISSNANQSGIFDLAYNTHHVAALNSNRTSPFENGINASNSFPIPFNASTNPTAVNTLISQPTSTGYAFSTLPQHTIGNVFQSQLQDRL